MDWWHKMIFPVRRVWISVSARVKARKNGAFLLPPPHIFFSPLLIITEFSDFAN